MPSQAEKFDVDAAEIEAFERMRAYQDSFVPTDEHQYYFQVEEYEVLEREWKRLRNTCPQCCKDDRLERRNYDMVWGEADLYCGRCNIKIRGMDFG